MAPPGAVADPSVVEAEILDLAQPSRSAPATVAGRKAGGYRYPRMIIVFTKLPGSRHEILVHSRNGPDVRLPARETGPTIPHDLAHAAVETALGFDDGFWATMEKGATFEGFVLVQPSRHKRSGIKLLRRLEQESTRAEMAVSWAHRVWSGQRTEGQGLGATPIEPAQLKLALRALDDARERWDALSEGQSLKWTWCVSGR